MSDVRTVLVSCGRVDIKRAHSIASAGVRPATRPDAPPLSFPGGLGGAYALLRPPVVPPVVAAIEKYRCPNESGCSYASLLVENQRV